MTWRARMQSRNPGAKRSTCASICGSISTVERVRHVAIGPRGVLPGRRARGVERRVLRQQHERTFGMPAFPRGTLGCGDLVERAADVHCRRPPARLGGPRNRRRERPVDFEHPHAVSVPLQLSPVRRRQAMARNPEKRRRRQIAQDCAGVRQLVDGRHRCTGHNLSAERPQVRHERIGQVLRAPAWKHPPGQVRGRPEHESERCRDGVLERQHPVRGQPGKERARVGVGERARRESACRPDRRNPNRARRSGCRGQRGGPSSAGSRRAQPSTTGPIRFRYARASMPSDRAVSSTSCTTAAARPSSSGCANITGGRIQSRPCLASGNNRNAREIGANG